MKQVRSNDGKYALTLECLPSRPLYSTRSGGRLHAGGCFHTGRAHDGGRWRIGCCHQSVAALGGSLMYSYETVNLPYVRWSSLP